jgi:hypothetical protein
MVTESFKKELVGLSPWQLTQAVKHWMENNDARMELSFNWACPSGVSPDDDEKDWLWLKKSGWKSYAKKIVDETKYVKL